MTQTNRVHRLPKPGRSLDTRNNSLNLVRLLLATFVIVSHTFVIGGFGKEPMIAEKTLGTWGVYGFFCLSGYLIMGSRQRYGVGEFMVHRLARIYPGYIVCLILTVVVFAPIAYLVDRGTLGGYLTAHPTTPLTHLWGNAFLNIQSYDVSGTLPSVPYPNVWNGSLWSLHHEFLCYLMLACLGLWATFRRSRILVGGLFLLSVAAFANITTVQSYVAQGDIPLLLSLVPLFLGGSLVYLFSDGLRMSVVGAVVAVLFTTVAVWLLPGWGIQLSGPAILYVLLWLGSVLPSPQLIRTHDVSYGMYIYAFPAQQLLALAGATALGTLLFIVLSIAATVPLAVASWFIIERPVMRRARPPRPSPVTAAASPASPHDEEVLVAP